MILVIEISDDDLLWLFAALKHGSMTVNRYSKEQNAIADRLSNAGLIEQLPYYGESMCYHPSYRLTPLGHKAKKQWDEKGRPEANMKAVCEALGFDPTNHHNAAKCPYCQG